MEKSKFDIDKFIASLKERLLSQMPRIQKEIMVYEKNVSLGIEKKNPKPSPQFTDVKS
jgi:hypothetical protein